MIACLPKFISELKDFLGIAPWLKAIPCPYCSSTGFMICHGYLRGNFEESVHRGKGLIRAKRVFCSNRNRRKGCGRTVSILLSAFLKDLYISSSTLYSLLLWVASGNRAYTFKASTTPSISVSSCYRLLKALRSSLSEIRVSLHSNANYSNPIDVEPCQKPFCHSSYIDETASILSVVLQELQGALTRFRENVSNLDFRNENPLSMFQLKFQKHLLQ